MARKDLGKKGKELEGEEEDLDAGEDGVLDAVGDED
jgi:hypothetical protein